MKCSGVWASGTTYITFEDVKVPVENLIGEETTVSGGGGVQVCGAD
jgi:alkylation response protein AidB-like acyl-CoA dehydrogenase